MAFQIRRAHRILPSPQDFIALHTFNRANRTKVPGTLSLVLALVALISSSCSSLEVMNIEPNKESKEDTLTYCLLVPKLQLTIKEAIVYDKKLDPPIDPVKDPLANAGRSITSVTASLIQVPSNTHYYAAHMKSGWFTSDAHRIDYDVHGCLNSYNFQTNDQAGTVVSTVASIALAAAATMFREPDEATVKVTVPEPSLTTYLIHQKSRQLLTQAEKFIAKPNKTPAETKLIEDVLEKAAKLRDLLNPVPTRISRIEYQDLYFAPKGTEADAYIVELVKGNIKGTMLDEDSSVVGVVRRLNQ